MNVAIISKYPIEVLNRNIPNFIEEISQARYEVKLKLRFHQFMFQMGTSHKLEYNYLGLKHSLSMLKVC